MKCHYFTATKIMLNKLLDFIHKVYRVAGRIIIKNSMNPRPSSCPYITGDGFRNIANYVYDNSQQNFDPRKVGNNDIIFVGDSNIKKFLKEFHPYIEKSYILVTHNGDEEIDEDVVSLMDEKILRWYGINVTVCQSKVTPLPLGIGNKHYFVTGIPTIFRSVAKKRYPKTDRIFYCFTTSTNPKEREPALSSMQRNKFADTILKWINFPNYMKLLATYKFVISPPGSSVEGHRTWEAMYVGVVPIVKNSVTTEYFKKLNMPLWVISDWSELDFVDEQKLNEKYKDIIKSSNYDVLYMDYWVNKIKNIEE